MSTLPPSADDRGAPRRAHLAPRRLVVAFAVSSTLLAVAPAAAGAADHASKIVYECAPNLCVVHPDSGATSPLTTDGTSEKPYTDPSVSRDGRRVAAIRGNEAFVGAVGGNLTERWTGSQGLNDIALSPDGSGLAESHSYVRNVYGCPLTGGCLKLVDESDATFATGPVPPAGVVTVRGGAGVGFLGNGSLLTSSYDIQTDSYSICVVPDPGAGGERTCAVQIIDLASTLTAPAGSLDSRLIAVAVGARPSAGAPVINLYDAASGAKLRQLVAGGTNPTFSPDGKQVAYQGADGWVHVVSTTGRHDRKLVAGAAPAWSGGQGPGPAVASKSLRYRAGAIRTSIRCTGTARCRGKLTLKKGRVTLGHRSYAVKAGKRATVKVKPTARGKRTIAKARKHRVTVRLKPKKGKSVTTKLTLRR